MFSHIVTCKATIPVSFALVISVLLFHLTSQEGCLNLCAALTSNSSFEISAKRFQQDVSKSTSNPKEQHFTAMWSAMSRPVSPVSFLCLVPPSTSVCLDTLTISLCAQLVICFGANQVYFFVFFFSLMFTSYQIQGGLSTCLYSTVRILDKSNAIIN